MHKFVSKSGKELWYDVCTNRISLWNSSKKQQTCPVVLYKEPKGYCGDKITMFTFEMTQQCNLRCTYCCYSGEYRGVRAHNSKEISFDVLDRAVDFIMEHVDKTSDEITICFYGGEALLAKAKMQYLMDKLDVLFGYKVCYSLSTNGLALTESVIDWICSYDKFLVNVTIDGDEMMHDAHRLTVSGKGSYRTIVKNFTIFKEKYPEQYNQRVRFLATVYSLNDVRKLSQVWDKIDVLRGKHPMHIGHILPNFSDCQRVYDTKQLKDEFYSEAFQDFKNDVDSIKTYYFKKLISIVERRSFIPLLPELKIKTCYQEMFSCFINVDGDIYACEKFCDEYSVGNIFTGFDEEKMMNILRLFTEKRNKHCRSCWAQRLCRLCLTGLNHTDEELFKMCEMERNTIDLALKYYCEMIDWKQTMKKDEQ